MPCAAVTVPGLSRRVTCMQVEGTRRVAFGPARAAAAAACWPSSRPAPRLDLTRKAGHSSPVRACFAAIQVLQEFCRF